MHLLYLLLTNICNGKWLKARVCLFFEDLQINEVPYGLFQSTYEHIKLNDAVNIKLKLSYMRYLFKLCLFEIRNIEYGIQTQIKSHEKTL